MEFQNIKLLRAKPPNLNAGTYTVHVEQTVQEPAEKELPLTDRVFHVGGRRFCMEQGIVHSVYPPADSSGNYQNTLPHIVFNQASFPWLRRVYSGQTEDTLPFVALICLSEGEDFQEGQLTIEQLTHLHEPDIYFPKFDDDMPGEKPEDLCSFVDIGCELFEHMMPREDELEYLAHVRIANLYDKSDSLTGQDGSFSVVICSRFPESPAGESRRNHAFLVSLENYHECLPQGGHFQEVAACRKVRLPVLYKWSFDSTAKDTPGFCHIMEALDVGTLSLPDTGKKNDAAEIAGRGYIPLLHITRTGEKTVSFYRSPLVPYQEERRLHRECRSADGEIRYDPVLGMFDMSYAAAWQIGRFMALSDQEMARQIYLWRREIILSLHRSYARSQFYAGCRACPDIQNTGELRRNFLQYLVQPDSVLGQLKCTSNTEDSSGLLRRGIEQMLDASEIKQMLHNWKAGGEMMKERMYHWEAGEKR